MADKSSFYRERAKALEKRLEHEQEWETYFPGITNREYSTYADTCACGMARRLDEIEAADLVASWCGFQRERITIVTKILIEVQPKYVEVWDTSDDGYAFQLFIDFENKTVEPKIYDKK